MATAEQLIITARRYLRAVARNSTDVQLPLTMMIALSRAGVDPEEIEQEELSFINQYNKNATKKERTDG